MAANMAVKTPTGPRSLNSMEPLGSAKGHGKADGRDHHCHDLKELVPVFHGRCIIITDTHHKVNGHKTNGGIKEKTQYLMQDTPCPFLNKRLKRRHRKTSEKQGKSPHQQGGNQKRKPLRTEEMMLLFSIL